MFACAHPSPPFCHKGSASKRRSTKLLCGSASRRRRQGRPGAQALNFRGGPVDQLLKSRTGTPTEALPRLCAHALVLAALALAPLPAAAQVEQIAEPPKALKQLSLEELFDLEVTSVSKKPESISKTAAAVHVVTADDLRRMGAVSIPEALRCIPGVEV